MSLDSNVFSVIYLFMTVYAMVSTYQAGIYMESKGRMPCQPQTELCLSKAVLKTLCKDFGKLRKTPLTMVRGPADILTRHLGKTSLMRYRYSKLFGRLMRCADET
jgi:hypothetical protein